MIVVKVWNPDGTLLGVCDESCHDACGETLTCVCGGYFRGATHRGGIVAILAVAHAQVCRHLAATYPDHGVLIRPPQLSLWQQLET